MSSSDPTTPTLTDWIAARRETLNATPEGPWFRYSQYGFQGVSSDTHVIAHHVFDHPTADYIAAHDPATVTLMLDVIDAFERLRQAGIEWALCQSPACRHHMDQITADATCDGYAALVALHARLAGASERGGGG